MAALSTLDIDRKLETSNFLGAFAFDELPPRQDNDFSVIVNTESSTEAGEHWIAIIFKKKKFYFIDSYGRSPVNALFTKDFKNKIKDYFKDYHYKYNPRMLQDIFSNMCGYYSIYFIREMENKSLKQALSIFNSNLKNNDALVKEIVNFY